MGDIVTILVSTNMVIVNGLPRTVDCSALVPARTHAVQWDGEAAGHVEFYNPPGTEDVKLNQPLTNMDAYQSYVDAWYAAAPPDPGPMPVYRDANARLDDGIAAAEVLQAGTLKKPPEPPANGWPPTVPADVQQSLDYIMSQLTIVFDQLAVLADSHIAMIDAQKTEEAS